MKNVMFKKAILILALSIGLSIPVLSTTVSAGLFDGAKGQACDAVGASKTDSSGNVSCDQGALSGSETTLSTTLTNLLNLVTAVVGIIAVIMIIISGIRFLTSNGDSGQITSARNTFIYALVGLVLVAFAQIIVKLVLSRIS